jgi:hypothetical protein
VTATDALELAALMLRDRADEQRLQMERSTYPLPRAEARAAHDALLRAAEMVERLSRNNDLATG